MEPISREVIDKRLRAIGHDLPLTAPAPAGAYAAVVVRNGIGFVSGQFPYARGELAYKGRVGRELSEQEASHAAEIAASNVLAHIANATDQFNRFRGLLRLEGYVASAGGFLAQPRVLDAASRFFVTALGNTLGAHARTAFAVERLPLDASVELCVTFASGIDGTS